MPQLVNEDQDAEDKEEREDVDHAVITYDDRSVRIVSAENRRAHTSAARISARFSGVPAAASAWSSAPAITRGMLEKPRAPARNASTATSLAAFRTTGQARPCLRAS